MRKFLPAVLFIALVLVIIYLIPMIFSIAWFIAKLAVALILAIIIFFLGRAWLKKQ
jgi:hypothetical protein